MNGKIIPLVADVTSRESLAAAAAAVRAKEGYVDVVLANSGVYDLDAPTFSSAEPPPPSEVQSKLWDVPIESFNQVLHVNVSGVLYTAVAFLDLLDAANHRQPPATFPPRPKSQVIIVSSICAFTRSPSFSFAYVASKAAATQMAKQLATTLAPYKIRVNTIAPGMYPTEMNSHILKDSNPRIEGNIPAAFCPLGRSGTEDEMSGLALYLISRAGAYVNGSVSITDGGMLSLLPASY